MRILLVSNASYDPPRGGSTRSNLVWLRHLAAKGHECTVVAPTHGGEADRTTVRNGITIRGVKELSFRVAEFGRAIRETRPDWVLVSSEDVGHVLLREAAHTAPGRIVYLAHTPQFYPFGPESWHKDEAAAALIRQAAKVVVIGEHMAGYVREHLGREAVVVHPPMYGEPPYAEFGRFGAGYVLMVNPCVVKGISIFEKLAAAFPEVEFAALNGWGTTRADRETLGKLSNTRLLENVPDIEDVLRGARMLLMPSVWYEGFGLIAMEAMLRGLPVVASDSGGLKEAKRGTGYVIAVRPVERYEAVFDEQHMPRAILPAQEMGEWVEAVGRLLTDEVEYWAEARRSREAALRFVAKLDAGDLEKMLLALPVCAEPLREAETGKALDAQKRALLLARLRKKAQP